MRIGKLTPESTFRFPLPGESNDTWRLLAVYNTEGKGAKALNLRTQEKQCFSAAELIIPEISVKEPVGKVSTISAKQEHGLSRPVYKGLYISLVLLLCLVLYLVMFGMIQ